MKNPTYGLQGAVALTSLVILLASALFALSPVALAQTPIAPPAPVGSGTLTATSTVTPTATLPPTRVPATPTRVVTVDLGALGSGSSIVANSPTPTLTPTVTPTPTSTPTATHTPTHTATRTWTSTSTPTRTLVPTLTLIAAASPVPTSTPTLVPTSDVPGDTLTPGASGVPVANAGVPAGPTRYALALNSSALSIETLRARPYGGSPIKITRVLSSDTTFQRVLFEYMSDGLRITGMMHIPQGIGPFPVIILDHGYFKPSEYKTGDGTIRAADFLVKQGYLTLAPDYRCYGGSQCGSNPLDVGYAIDVLNLIASLPSLPYADTGKLGIWGHSMGGAITIRVLAVADQIQVAALYGAVTGDDETHYCWLNGCRTPVAPTREPKPARLSEIDPDFMIGLPTPVAAAADPLGRLRDIFQGSSPLRHLNYIHAPVIIHHGEADDIVPIDWSVGLADALTATGKTARVYTYPAEGHVFGGWNWNLFMNRTLAFYNQYLNPRATPVTADQRVLRQERGILDSTW